MALFLRPAWHGVAWKGGQHLIVAVLPKVPGLSRHPLRPPYASLAAASHEVLQRQPCFHAQTEAA